MTFLGLILLTFNLSAVDRVVQESGPSGTYNSIGDAVLAASNGDRIIINNRASNLPWTENITIDKSLTFLSAVNGERYKVQGNYIIERAAGREVIINGMDNNYGTITTLVGGTPSSRTKISILNSKVSGIIDLDEQQLDVLIASTRAEYVYISYGRVIGDSITERLIIYNDSSNLGDTVYVIGNYIGNSSENNTVLFIRDSSQVLYISNNLIKNRESSSGNATIYFSQIPRIGSILINNTVTNYYFGPYTGYSVFNAGNIIVMNNILGGTFNGSLVNCWYNQCSQTDLGVARGNKTSSSTVNSGNPSNLYLDTDLSRNDMGIYGGSYSFTNFHPIDNGKSSRVSFFKVPRLVNSGTTFNVEGIGFDK